MELVLLFAFAAIFAVAFNYGQPRLLGKFPSLAANYWGTTLLTAVTVMILLVAVSWAFAEAGEKV